MPICISLRSLGKWVLGALQVHYAGAAGEAEVLRGQHLRKMHFSNMHFCICICDDRCTARDLVLEAERGDHGAVRLQRPEEREGRMRVPDLRLLGGKFNEGLRIARLSGRGGDSAKIELKI